MSIPPELLNTITTGDARELAELIPDCSVDIVFTDPPYCKEDIPLYEWLGHISHRILKPGGYLFAYTSAYYLPATFEALQQSCMTYFWQFVLTHHGGHPRVWSRNLLSAYKPVLAYSKGKPIRQPWIPTVWASNEDKRYHFWGQGEGPCEKLLRAYTHQEDIVFDPFTGGGTVPAVCKMLGRQYVAFEIDEQTAERARLRVEQTQMPLPGLLVEQSEMDLAV